MVVDIRPKQPEFSPISEEWGKIILSDGSIVETRVILSDLTILSEDLLGMQFATSNVIALRVRSPQKLKEEVLNAPVRAPITQLPLIEEVGFERVEIEKIEKPTISRYRFNGHIVTLEVDIKVVIRNMKYKAPSGAPVYHVRWSIDSKIEKETE